MYPVYRTLPMPRPPSAASTAAWHPGATGCLQSDRVRLKNRHQANPPPLESGPATVYPGRMKQTLTIRRPDDMHLHLRDGAMLAGVAPCSARHFARAVIMPNLVPPVVTGDQARAYRDRILAALPDGTAFEPLMTLYLTEGTDPEDVAAAHASGLVKAVKLYPAGATTNSQSGVHNLDTVRGVLERMAGIGLPLCVHGEVTDPAIDIFDREAVFIDTVLDPLRRSLPGLRVVMEHITTCEGVAYAKAGAREYDLRLVTPAGATSCSIVSESRFVGIRVPVFVAGRRAHGQNHPVEAATRSVQLCPLFVRHGRVGLPAPSVNKAL